MLLLCLTHFGNVVSDTIADFNEDYIKGITILEWDTDVLKDDELRSTLVEAANIGTNWISLSMLLIQTSENSSDVQFWNNNATDIVNDFNLISEFIEYAHSLKFQVMLKPMVHTKDAPFSIHINPTNIEEWFMNYQDIILQYASLAQSLNVELISIGCELLDITSNPNNTEYWLSLITNIRKIYNGNLTYASLFMYEYMNIEFWNELDLIGIDAYFPLTDTTNKYPDILQLTDSWMTQLTQLLEWRENANLSINFIFTEVGYPSVNIAPIEPYYNPTKCSDNPDDVGGDEYITNMTMQSMCYQALFNGLTSDIGKDIVDGIFIFWIDTPDTLDYYSNNNSNGELYECFLLHVVNQHGMC